MYTVQCAGTPTKISKNSRYDQIFTIRTHTVKSYAPTRQTHLVLALAPPLHEI
jgi:hypothetical protein